MGLWNPFADWTKEGLDKKAQEDVKRGEYDPPYAHFPGRELPGNRNRDTYDDAFDHHKSRSKKR